ncbi:ribonuclease H-like protein [Phanerochaete sordida]|uniref:ribonuclease H n=1 Tax=Phanerochaete sordida TaxID=48140 RepID=A0A9P3FYG0_9APHY|nr:ribonuclease H-like protein [Phanerochaete sordida]
MTRHRKAANADARPRNDALLFDPSVTETEDVGHIIRVFANPGPDRDEPAYRGPARGKPVGNPIVVYTDGSCLENGDEDARAGLGVWFGVDHASNLSARVPGPVQSNQVGEVLAIEAAAKLVPPFTPLHIKSDSKYAVEGLTTHVRAWEDKGWLGVANADALRAAVAALRRRTAPTWLQWVKGHAGEEGNEGADRLAGEGAFLPPRALPPLDSTDLRFLPEGAKLAALTQALAYKGIRATRAAPPRTTSVANVALTRAAVYRVITPHMPTDKSIWKAVRKEQVRRNVSDFLWKLLHGSHKVGRYWAHIPDHEHRAECLVCPGRPVESMEHILLHCVAPERARVWALCEELWRKRWHAWPDMALGLIMGSTLAGFQADDGGRDAGASRLYGILVSESAHLIWCLRCTRRIEHEDLAPPLTDAYVTRRWLARINDRLQTDAALTHPKYGRKARPKPAVLATWSGTLLNEHLLPDDWTSNTQLLVGIRARE